MSDKSKFPNHTKKAAFDRQGHKCASCNTEIAGLGHEARNKHKHGERAEAHHIKHVQHGGSNDLSNCVILCWSCHFSAHGGNFGDKDPDFIGKESDFPYFIDPTLKKS